MFYDHFSARSLLAKLGRWGWWWGWGWLERKARRHQIHQKDYIEIRPEAPGVWTKDLINFIPIYCHHWDCRLGPVQVRQAWEYLRGGGGWNVLVGGRLQLGLRFWFPPDPRRRCCSTFLNLNWWKGYCYHKILIMVPRLGDGDPSFPVHPHPS